MNAELPEGEIMQQDNTKVEKFGRIEYTFNDFGRHEKGFPS
jgi:hypothetical protein